MGDRASRTATTADRTNVRDGAGMASGPSTSTTWLFTDAVLDRRSGSHAVTGKVVEGPARRVLDRHPDRADPRVAPAPGTSSPTSTAYSIVDDSPFFSDRAPDAARGQRDLADHRVRSRPLSSPPSAPPRRPTPNPRPRRAPATRDAGGAGAEPRRPPPRRPRPPAPAPARRRRDAVAPRRRRRHAEEEGGVQEGQEKQEAQGAATSQEGGEEEGRAQEAPD